MLKALEDNITEVMIKPMGTKSNEKLLKIFNRIAGNSYLEEGTIL